MYSALRKDKAFSCRKLAKALSEKFPVINAQIISYAERPRDSGITYTTEARREIDSLCNPLTAPKKSERKCPEHLSVWLPKGFLEVLNTNKKVRGFDSIHDYVIFLIDEDKKSIEKAAQSAGTEQDGTINCCEENIARNGATVK